MSDIKTKNIEELNFAEYEPLNSQEQTKVVNGLINILSRYLPDEKLSEEQKKRKIDFIYQLSTKVRYRR